MDLKSMSVKHLLIMVACCLIPIVILGAVLFLQVDLGRVGLFAIVLLCPLMHILMMRGMGHKHGNVNGDCHQEPARLAEAQETAGRKSA